MTNSTSAKSRPSLIGIDQVAEHLGVSVRHVRRLVAERRIPFVKWGHLLRFDPVALDQWIEASIVQPIDFAMTGQSSVHGPRRRSQ